MLQILCLFLVALWLVYLPSCSGGLGGNATSAQPQPGTTPGTYSMTITATTGSVTRTTTALLTVQ